MFFFSNLFTSLCFFLSFLFIWPSPSPFSTLIHFTLSLSLSLSLSLFLYIYTDIYIYYQWNNAEHHRSDYPPYRYDGNCQLVGKFGKYCLLYIKQNNQKCCHTYLCNYWLLQLPRRGCAIWLLVDLKRNWRYISCRDHD